MATAKLSYTRAQIDSIISQVHNKSFSNVMSGITPDGTKNTQLVTVEFVTNAIDTAMGDVNTILDSINGVSI